METLLTGRGNVIRFDVFEVDLASGQLTKRNRRVKVQDLPFRLLVALLEKPGGVVTREQLRERLWGGTVVDFDDGLHTAVRKLRDALGDSAAHPRFIETRKRLVENRANQTKRRLLRDCCTRARNHQQYRSCG